MPTWLMWILPMVIQIVTPLIVEGIRKAMSVILSRVPGSLTVVVAGAIGEGLNALQTSVSGAALPPGVPGLIAIILNEIKNDLNSSVPAKTGI